MWTLLKTFGLDKIAVKGLIGLAAIIAFIGALTVAYMAGKRDESIVQELKRKDAVISGLKADLELQKDLTKKAEADRTEISIQRSEDEVAIAAYEAKLKALAEKNKNDHTDPKKGQVSQCSNVCAIDNDFLRVLGRRRVR